MEDSETDIAACAVYRHHIGGAVSGEYVQAGILTWREKGTKSAAGGQTAG